MVPHRPDISDPDLLQQAIDELSSIFYIIKPDGSLYWWNDHLADVTGYSEAELADMKAMEFVPESERELLRDAIEQTLESGQIRIETYLETATGAQYPYELTGKRLSSSERDFIGLVGTGRDISNRHYEKSVQDIQTPIQSATKAGAISTWNWYVPIDRFIADAEFARLFGIDPEKARHGIPLDDVTARIHEDDIEDIREAINTAINNCGSYEEEYRVYDQNDDVRWVMARGEVRCNDDGDPVQFSGALTDITTQKQYEQQLEAQRDDLQLLNQVLRHDIRNELQLVSAYADFLADNLPEEDENHKYAEISELPLPTYSPLTRVVPRGRGFLVQRRALETPYRMGPQSPQRAQSPQALIRPCPDLLSA